MHTFKDKTGHDWTLEIDYDMAVKLNDATGFDIQTAFDKESIASTFSDIFKVGGILWTTLSAQAGDLGITQEQFAKRINGDALEDATIALMEEIIDFFPRARRSALRASVTKTREIENLVAERAVKMLESGSLNAEIENALTGKSSAVSSPASAV